MAKSVSEYVSWVIRNNTGRRVAVYSKPTTTCRTVVYLEPGNGKYTVTAKNGNFCFIVDTGWVKISNITIVQDNTEKGSASARKATNNTSSKKTSSTNSNSAVKAETSIFNTKDSKKPDAKDKNTQKTIYREYVNSEYGHVVSTTGVANKVLSNNLNGVYGIPYQFPASVDPKIGTNKVFGSIYADRILSRMPLLMISPGQVDFMATYDEGEKSAVYDALRNSNAMSQSTLNDFVSKPGKYYTFKYDDKTYWKYVNGMNRACAIYLGLGDLRVDIGTGKGALSGFKWENACNSAFNSLLISNKSYVCFYLDADPTRTETFSNSTTESQLASKVNSYSDIAKEIQFLVGTQSGKKLKWIEEEGIGQIQQKLNSMCDKFLNGSEVFKNVTKEFAVIATGGKLIFPEIWADSEFSQSYDINIKLRCPNPNKLSWYLDVCVPLNHLLALTMPRSPEGKDVTGTDFEPSANGYMTPFLVRAFSRGLFNCDMGIITNLSISKGKEGSWSIDGLPSEVDVSLEIKDLFNLMAMTHPDNTIAFMNNNQYLNYIANSCGISINKPDLQRSVDLYLSMKKNYFRDRLSGYNFWASVRNGVQNKMLNMYQGIFKG